MTALIILAVLVATYTPVDAYPAEGSIRLVGGSDSHEGRVEIYLLGRWGTVCTSFSFSAAVVVCRQLGYSIDSDWRNRTFGRGSGFIWLQSVQCTGYEANILQCRRSGLGIVYSSCRYHNSDAGVICSKSRTSESVTEGSIRLANGSTRYEGRLEVFTLGHWATVCASNWGWEEATVACRQLGFGTALSLFRRAEFGPGSGFISLSIRSCTGYESSVIQCGYSIRSSSSHRTCNYYGVAGVNCSAEKSKETEGSIRLLGGSSSHEGIVEMFFLGQWTTVCSYHWDMSEAEVACRQLGYSGAVAAPRGAIFSAEIQWRPFEVYIWTCSGYEVNLTYCAKSFTEQCGVIPAGVICSNMNFSFSEEGSIRLVGGSNSLEGRVEINIHGHWGTVCGNLWDMDDATVVCRQLGYPTALQAHKEAIFGSGRGIIWLDEVKCTGFETNLTQCRSKGLGVHSCSHYQDAGVTCSNQQGVRHSDGDIRLVGGSGPHEGLVEIFFSGVWGRVCTRLLHLHHLYIVVDSTGASTVVCRQLGYPKAVPLSRYSHQSSTNGTDLIWLDVTCNDSETSITQCSNLGLGVHNCYDRSNENILAVSCSSVSNDVIEENTVRLVEGTGNNTGFVELYLLGQWIPICGYYSWDILDANVVCRELGYLTAVSATRKRHYNYRHYRGFTPYTYSCTGDESTLKQCSTNERYCSNYYSAFVNCSDAADIADSDTEAGAVRLVAGSGPHEGRVEVVFLNTWGTVCGSSWDLLDAIVVCRQLGYNTALSASVGAFGEGSGPIWLNQVHCHGNESNLTQCRSSFASDCNHFQDAGVICSGSSESAVHDGALRLVDGLSEHEGRVEVYHFGLWGTVDTDEWDLLDAIVVCHQLSYSAAVSTNEYSFNSSAPVWLSYVHCTGLESKLTQCKNRGPRLHSPSYHSAAGVVCAENASVMTIGMDEDSIRLSGGQNAHEGHVDVLLNGHWFSVCDLNWDLLEAIVACRQLGYHTAEAALRASPFNNTGGPNWMVVGQCTGYEANLTRCSPNYGIESCRYNHAGIICSNLSISAETPDDGSIRLVGGPNAHAGHVEMYLLGHWVAACFPYWDLVDATVVCRQLGYPAALIIQNNAAQTFFGGENKYLWLQDLRCNGNETRIIQCDHGMTSTSYCPYNGDTSVTCSETNIATEEKETTVRLVGGQGRHEGRVQMYLLGHWATVCGYSWDLLDAVVVCRQLGYPTALASVKQNVFGGRDDLLWSYEMDCNGYEVNLLECKKRPSSCSRSSTNVAGVVCSSDAVIEKEGSVRLVGGTQPHEGLVEMFLLGQWGTLCRPYYSYSWTLSNANTICQHLGYPGAAAALSRAIYAFQIGSGPTWYLNVEDCVGNQVNLTQCSRSVRSGLCSENEVVGVICTVWRFEQSEYHVSESQRSVTIRIVLNSPATKEVTLLLRAEDVTAEFGMDYGGPKKHQLVIPAGSTSTSAAIRILNDDVSESKEEFRLTIEPEGIVQLVPSDETVIYIVDDDSCQSTFLLLETPANSRAELPCSQLDGSFLPGGMVTARCTANSTWGPLDMSQCTFTNDISVAAVAVVEVQSLVEDSISEMDTIARSSYVNNATLQDEYYNIYGERVQVYSVRLNQTVSAKELKRSLELATAVISRVIVIRRDEFCSCCDSAAIELSASLFKTIESCTGSHEALIACTCLNGSSQCQPRFSSTSGSCFLDTDRDGKPDYMDPCVGCCLHDYNFGFQWKQTSHNYYDEAPCSEIHPSFSDTKVRRKCLPDDTWGAADISSCTFKNTTRNPIYLLTTNLVVTQDVNKTEIIAGIQQTFEKQLPNFTREASLNSTGYEITSLESSITYANGTTVSTLVFVVEFESSVVLRENVTSVKEDETPNGVTYTFEEIVAVKPSGSCSCKVSSGHLANLCIGTSSSPCDCSDFGTCRCIDPYVDDDGECSLDTDGDSTPDYRDECPGTFGNDSKGCSLTVASDQGFCPAEEDTVWRIQWPDATPGSTQSVRCPGEGDVPGLGLAHRNCLTGGVWGSVDASNCESVAIRDIRIQTRNLNKDLSFARTFGLPVLPQQRNAVRKISVNLRSALKLSVSRQASVKSPVLPRDLKTSTRLLSLIADLGENNDLFTDDRERKNTEQQEEIVLDIVSSLLQEENEPSFAATTKGADPNESAAVSPAVQILESTEKVANAVTASRSKERRSVALYRSNIAVHGRPLSFNQLRNTQSSFQFPGPGVMLLMFSRPALVPMVEVPSAFISAAKGREYSMGVNTTSDEDDEMTGLATTLLNNIEKFLPDTLIDEPTQERMSDHEGNHVKPQTLPASLVLSSQIAGYSGGEVDSNATVGITFPIKEEIRNISVPSDSVIQFRCAFFNFTGGANRTGGWSYRGVQTEVINDTHVRCNAAHLTSFVVLVSIIPAEDTPVNPLDYITYIGCSISLLCLLACIAFFISLRKELITKLHNFVHLNLCIALALGLFLFLTGIQTATANVGACKFIAVLLHYFFLATFTWTLCEALLIYNLLKAAFGANNRKWIYVYLIFGWVLPIPVVLISVASRHEYYLIRHSFDEDSPLYNQVKACWLPSEKGMIFAFVGPMIVILLINAVLLIISLAALAETQSGSSGDNENGRKEHLKAVGKRLFKATIILVPVMGFTWIIGLFAVGEEGKVFAYLFVIANVFQGLFIFLFHVVRHEKVYGKIKNKLPNLKSLITERSGVRSAATSGIDSSKVTSAAAGIGAVGDERAGDNDGEEDKGMLELIGRLVDDDERTTESKEHEVPRPGTAATTMFVEGSVKNEDKLTGSAIEDDEKTANAYDVPRPTTGATYYNI